MPSETVYLRSDQDLTIRKKVNSGDFKNYSKAVQYAVQHTFMGDSE